MASNKYQEYYAKLGWAVFPMTVVSLKLQAGDSTSASSNVELLDKEAIKNLCDRDVAQLTKELMQTQSGKSLCMAFEPSYESLSWHFARAEYTGQILREQVPTVYGAINQAKNSWIYWFHDFRAGELLILRVVLPAMKDDQVKADLEELLSAAVSEAEKWGMESVKVKDADGKEVGKAALALQGKQTGRFKVDFVQSTEFGVPSLRLQDGRSSKAVKWLCNEYYAWC
jgi:hypothetical protein